MEFVLKLLHLFITVVEILLEFVKVSLYEFLIDFVSGDLVSDDQECSSNKEHCCAAEPNQHAKKGVSLLTRVGAFIKDEVSRADFFKLICVWLSSWLCVQAASGFSCVDLGLGVGRLSLVWDEISSGELSCASQEQ